MKCKVSIIIPCFNHGRYLPEAIQSCLEQSYGNIEVIIVNDGSDDDTEAVAMSFHESDSRVVFLTQENRGLAAARNAGLSVATGDYVQFLDADDLLHRDKLVLQVKKMSALPGPVVSWCDYLSCEIDDLNREVKARYLPSTSIYSNKLYDFILRWENKFSVPVHSFLFDAFFFKQQGLRFDEKLPNHEDLDCWLNILYYEPNIVCLDEKLAYYRIRADAMCSDAESMNEGYNMVLRKHLWKNVFRPFVASSFIYKFFKINRYF